GEATWTNEWVRLRQLSAPAVLGKTVVFGDNEGMLHFFNRANGEAALRLKLDGSPIEAAPVMAGQTLVVVTRSGGIFAVRPQ
ncbi:MAG: outer membrane protein assembly factor BamB, partial [Burkholderiaceae bacterium]